MRTQWRPTKHLIRVGRQVVHLDSYPATGFWTITGLLVIGTVSIVILTAIAAICAG